MPDEKILMGRDGNVVTFKLVGIGTYRTAVGFKTTYTKLLSEGVSEFIIDLGECEHLDSTFLGTLLGLAIALKQKGAGLLHVVKPNGMIRNLFRGTGLDQIFDMTNPTEIEPE